MLAQIIFFRFIYTGLALGFAMAYASDESLWYGYRLPMPLLVLTTALFVHLASNVSSRVLSEVDQPMIPF